MRNSVFVFMGLFPKVSRGFQKDFKVWVGEGIGEGEKQTQGGIKGFPRGNEKGIVVVRSMGINVQKNNKVLKNQGLLRYFAYTKKF